MAALLAEDADVIAARLFAVSFRPGTSSPLEFRKVRKHLASMAGLGKLKVFGYKPDYALALEFVLLWERSLLAARLAAGDSATLYVHLLRKGEAVRGAPDPEAAALDAIRTWRD